MKVTIPAYASATLNESLTFDVPDDWAPRVRALQRHTSYGPEFRRDVVGQLLDMRALIERGYSALAYDCLVAAERAAGR
jgi:hypothetical protein